MSKTLAVVDVGSFACHRTGHTNAPIAQRRFGDVTLLEWVVRRISDAHQIDQIVVLTPDCDAELTRRSLPGDTTVVGASERDSLARMAGVLRRFDASGAVRVSLSTPLVDPNLIDRLTTTAEQHPGLDYVGYCSRGGVPAMRAHFGLFAEWVRSAALIRAEHSATQRTDRDEPTRYLLAHPELFQLRLIPVPDLLDRNDVRLTADIEEDWDHLHTIVETLGADGLDWQRIVSLLQQQPALRHRMAMLNSSNRSVQIA